MLLVFLPVVKLTSNRGCGHYLWQRRYGILVAGFQESPGGQDGHPPPDGTVGSQAIVCLRDGFAKNYGRTRNRSRPWVCPFLSGTAEASGYQPMRPALPVWGLGCPHPPLPSTSVWVQAQNRRYAGHFANTDKNGHTQHTLPP